MAREPKLPKSVLDTQSLKALLGAMLEQVDNSRFSEADDDAQALMFDAWECDGRRKRVALARKALAISADCADAYLLLAQEAAPTEAEALALLTQGVAAGERALGPAAFEEDAGHFWGLIETRPYMRTRQALALALWAAGRREEAVGHAAELLRLNPGDNQGIRYVLINWRLTLGQDVEVAALLKRYQSAGDAQWTWPATLAAFRRSGDGPAARKALLAAIAANRFVTPYLLGRRKRPKTLPPFYSPGEMEEALIYLSDAGADSWAATPAALAWLAEQI